MATFWLFGLVFTAIACGWLLGRFARGVGPFPGGAEAAYSQYYRGLNYLLNDRPDEAIDAFIESLDVTKETVETHLALGNLMRRKGAVERAIRIHQNLLARPSLAPLQLQQANLELARDFISAGLYDRAERLLQDLVQQSEELRPTSLRHLVEIYESERDWAKAIETATRLLPRRNLFLSAPEPDPILAGAIAHFHCELAQRALEKNEFDGARAHLEQALQRDRDSVRASLLKGLLEFRAGHFNEAIAALHRVRHQDPALLPEILDTLRACYDAVGQRQQLREYLQESLQLFPSTKLALAVCEELQHQGGPTVAVPFLAEQMRVRPTLRGLLALTSMHREQQVEGEGRQNLDLLQNLLQNLVASKPVYKCQNCGFTGRNMHWLCPSCKQWNTVQPIRGAEGD